MDSNGGFATDLREFGGETQLPLGKACPYG